MAMSEGVHEYGRDPRLPRLRTAYDRLVLDGKAPWVMGGNPTPEEAEVQRAHDARRATVQPLAELMAEVPMVTGPDGTLLSPKVAARGDRGWDGSDTDRDSDVAARLAVLVKEMDNMAAMTVAFGKGNLDALVLAEQWQAIRALTKDGRGE